VIADILDLAMRRGISVSISRIANPFEPWTVSMSVTKDEMRHSISVLDQNLHTGVDRVWTQLCTSLGTLPFDDEIPF
jgi:hypothetical protein